MFLRAAPQRTRLRVVRDARTGKRTKRMVTLAKKKTVELDVASGIGLSDMYKVNVRVERERYIFFFFFSLHTFSFFFLTEPRCIDRDADLATLSFSFLSHKILSFSPFDSTKRTTYRKLIKGTPSPHQRMHSRAGRNRGRIHRNSFDCQILYDG